MAFGINTWRADTSPMITGLSKGAVLMGVITCTAGQSGQQYIPGTLAADLFVYSARSGAHTVGIGQDSAQGTLQGYVSWQWNSWSWQQDTLLFVFAKRRTDGTPFGITVLNDNNEILADHGFPSPQFVGTVTFPANATVSYQTPDNYVANAHDVTVNLRPGADKLIVTYMPDTGSDDTWYHVTRESILAAEGSVTVRVIVYTKASSYKLPSLHIFAVNSPQPSSTNYGLQISTSSQQLTFDSGAETLSYQSELYFNFVENGGQATYSVPSGLLGMCLSFYRKNQQNADGSDVAYFGVYQRSGNLLTIRTLLDYHRMSTGNPTYTVGGAQQRWTPLADVTYLSPSLITGVAAAISGPPAFGTQPQNTRVKPGAVASFTVTVTGSAPITYKWFKSGAEVPGVTGTTYSFTAQQSDDGATIRCQANNAVGQTSSATVSLTVSPLDQATITSYSINPASTTSGTTVTLSMAATGSQPLTLAILDPGGNTIASGTGTSLSKTITASSTNGGYYTFTAANSDAYGHTTSDAKNAVLTVSSPTPVVITQDASGGSVTQNGTFRLSCNSNYGSNAQYQWYKTSAGTFSYWGPGGGSDNGINADTTTAGAFQYYCVVTAQPGNTAQTSTVTVTVNPPAQTNPVFSQQPADCYVTAPNLGSFSCAASPVTSYQWYRNGSPVSGATGSSISTGSTTTANNGDTYSCVAYNGSTSTASSTGTLHVTASPSPVFSQQPVNCTVTAPNAGSFACSASPVTSYQWYKNGSAVSGATGSSISIGRTSTANDGDAYYCIAYNGTYSTVSNTAYLYVNSLN